MDIFFALFCGFIFGWLICFSGVGGGVLVIPTLSFFFAFPASEAIGTASAYAALTKVASGLEHIRIKNINYYLFLRVSAAAVPGLFISAFTINYLITQQPQLEAVIQEWLRYGIIAIILISIVFILKKTPAADTADTAADTASMPVILLLSCGVGLIMGATGIGGGVLLVPLLLSAGRQQPKQVVGTSILIALLLSGLTAIFYSAGGQIRYDWIVWMSLGSLAAIPIASRVLQRTPQHIMRYVLIFLVGAAVLLMLLTHY